VADEVFLCGTAAQIAPVTKIDGRVVHEGKVGRWTQALQDEYENVVRGRSDRYQHWLTPVYGHALAGSRR
jgi:branched-chain amino acid aminotransferase